MRYNRFFLTLSASIAVILYSCTLAENNSKRRVVVLPLLNLIELIGKGQSSSFNYFYKENFAKDSVVDGYDFFVKEGISRTHTLGNTIESELLKNRQSEEFSAILTIDRLVKGIIYSKMEKGGLKSNDKNIRETLEKNNFRLVVIDQPGIPDRLPPKLTYVRGNITCEYRVYMGGQMVYLQLYDNKAMEIYTPL